jgi:Cu(I)/Ag(I) efflux system protein CusF
MKMKTNLLLAAGLLSLTLGTSFAAETVSQPTAGTAAAGAASMAMTAGEVRKVDLAQGKVTLKHEAIANLDMPAMTMVFRVQSVDMLKNLKPGDKVQFHAESSGGAMLVTHIQAAR